MSHNHSFEASLRNHDICLKLFEEQCSSLSSSLTEGHSSETIIREKAVLQRKLDDLDESRKNVLLLSGNSDDSKWILSMYQEFSNINSKVDMYIVNKRAINGHKSYETNFKLERLPLPFFNGNIRDYLRFQTDFTDFFRPYLSPQRAAYALRRCLHSDIQDFFGLM